MVIDVLSANVSRPQNVFSPRLKDTTILKSYTPGRSLFLVVLQVSQTQLSGAPVLMSSRHGLSVCCISY
jgi:hypothetical protein